MYRKYIYAGLLFGWLGVLGLSIYAINLRNTIVNISGAAIANIKPLADAYVTLILVFSFVILLLVGLYFSVQHKSQEHK